METTAMSEERTKSEASKAAAPRPTDAELAILSVLWDRGPSTVREVHDALRTSQRSGYTTVLKLLQIMTEKGLVTRDESQRAHVYGPRLSEQRTQRQLLGDLVDRAFGGSSAKLVLQALSGRHATASELRDIRALLDEIEKGGSR
jgi:predicted transcriptional regulator